MALAWKSALVASIFASATFAEDVLISERQLQKRYIDTDGNWNQSFFHINDVHAHLDQFKSSGTDCEDPEDG
jgi:2',3'-cyclic-nucleotide 2'-phosphodiesterase (5'-nucleotidase family)